jgi:beta-lactamase superfamily II metal-dependent hydrolase
MRRWFVILLGIAALTTVPRAQSTDVIIPADRVADSVAVREEPSGTAVTIARLRKGEQAALIAAVPSWYRIRLTDGTEGFVPKARTTKTTRTTPVARAAAGDIPFKVHFLDVGTGDSAIIDIGDREIVIDGGNSPTVLREYVAERPIIDGPIELVVVTHGDTDHWKGLERLMNFDGRGAQPPQVLEFWDPGYDRTCNPPSTGGRVNYLAFVDDFRRHPGIRFVRPLENFHPPASQTGQIQPFTLPSLPGVTFTVLHSAAVTTSDNTECSYLINNASIVLKLQIGTTSFLFTGDANGKERSEPDANNAGHVQRGLLALEQQVPGTLKVDVLKVPHHGSETASTIPFIAKTNPSYAIISASTTHRLPKETTVHRYEAPNRAILRTDINHENHRDHILCIKEVSRALECNFESVFEEGGPLDQ